MSDAQSNNEPAERYVILVARQRSGTTVLRKMLSTDPDTRVLGEVFSSKNALGAHKKFQEFTAVAEFNYTKDDLDRFYHYYLEGFFDRVPDKSIVIDTKYNSFGPFTPYGRSPLDPPYFLEFARKRGFRIIHLVRRSILASLASEVLATRSAVWHAYPDEMVERPVVEIKMHAAGLRRKILQTLDEIELVRGVLNHYARAIEVHYEDLFLGREFSPAAIDSIRKLFERDACFDPSPQTVKRSPPLHRFITNYDEVVEAIRLDEELRARYRTVLNVDPLDVLGDESRL